MRVYYSFVNFSYNMQTHCITYPVQYLTDSQELNYCVFYTLYLTFEFLRLTLSGSQSVSKYNDFTEAKIERLVTIGTACNCSFFYSFPRKQQLDNHPVPLKHIPAEAE